MVKIMTVVFDARMTLLQSDSVSMISYKLAIIAEHISRFLKLVISIKAKSRVQAETWLLS